MATLLLIDFKKTVEIDEKDSTRRLVTTSSRIHLSEIKEWNDYILEQLRNVYIQRTFDAFVYFSR